MIETVSKTRKSKYLEDKILQRNFPLGIEPKIFKLNITNICNLSCSTCPYSKITYPQGYMSEKLFDKILDRDLEENSYIELFNFGEPFLHPKIGLFTQLLDQKNIHTLISTNGNVGHEKVEEVLGNTNIRLLVAIDSLRQEIYEKVRKKGDVEKVFKFIDLCEEYRQFDEQVKLLVVSTPFNQEYFDEVVEEYVDSFPVIKRPADTFGGEVSNEVSTHTVMDKPVERVPCVFPFINCCVEWDGSVSACCFDYNLELRYGNLKKNSLKELWNMRPWKEFRQAMLKGDLEKYPRCQKCDGWRNVLYDEKNYWRLVSEDKENYYYFKEDK